MIVSAKTGTARTARRRNHQRGFTMIEVLVAASLMVVILISLATIAAQWMPNWNRGMAKVQQSSQLSVGIDRIAADLAAAEAVMVGRANAPIFDGAPLSVTLVRSAGANMPPGKEYVRLIERADRQGLALVREHAPFTAVETGDLIRWRDPVVLVRAPYRVSFSFAGAIMEFQKEWKDAPELPRAIRIDVRDATSDRSLPVSTTVAVRATMKPDCVRAKSISDCVAGGRFDDPMRPPLQTGTPAGSTRVGQ